MKTYLKTAMGIVAFVSALTIGIIVSPRNHANALATLDATRTETKEDMRPLMEKYLMTQKEQCDLIAKYGGECREDVFGQKIAEALATFQ